MTGDALAAANAAKRDKTTTTQDILQRETDRMFRMFGARAALGIAPTAAPSKFLDAASPLAARV